MPRRTLRTALSLAAAVLLVGLGASCQKLIGDGCTNDTDCSLNFDRRCDLTQQGGYCTIPECEPERCPGEALCVEFRGGASRLARRFCLAPCTNNGDCRGGYVCAPPTVTGSATCPDDPGTGAYPECTRVLDAVPSQRRPRAQFCVPAPSTP